MIEKIKYEDKITTHESELNNQQKITSGDMNEIKSVVNNNADETNMMKEDIENIQNDIDNGVVSGSALYNIDDENNQHFMQKLYLKETKEDNAPYVIYRDLYDMSGNAYISNHVCSDNNLLLNANFYHTINQRGKTVYNQLGRYCIDRWILVKGGLDFNQSSYGLILYNGTKIRQIIEYGYNPSGGNYLTDKYVTCTIKTLTDGKTETHHVTAKPHQLSMYVENCYKVKMGYDSRSQYYYFDIEINTNQDVTNNSFCTIYYIKLELGIVSTPYVPRPYYEELRLCQRYYYSINKFDLNLYKRTTSSINSLISNVCDITKNMRSKYPQLILDTSKYSNGVWSVGNNAYYNIKTIEYNDVNNPSYLIYILDSTINSAYIGIFIDNNLALKALDCEIKVMIND